VTALLLFAITFVLVYLLGIQQLNVQFNQRTQAFVTSALIAMLQLWLFKLVPQPTNDVENLAYVMGGPFGMVSAMQSYPWLAERLARGKALLRRQA